MKKQTIVVGALALIILSLLAFNYYNDIKRDNFLKDYASVCVTERCGKMVQGTEWVSTFCTPTGENYTMVCNVTIDGQKHKVPLDKLKEEVNMSSIRECAYYTCDTEVLVKKHGGG